jgi:hypothetical protein
MWEGWRRLYLKPWDLKVPRLGKARGLASYTRRDGALVPLFSYLFSLDLTHTHQLAMPF